MSYASSAPAAVSGLITLLTDAGLTVVDGPQVIGDSSTDGWVIVGYSDGQGAAVTAVASPGNASLTAQRERYEIRNCIAITSGDQDDLASARAQAFQILATVGEALADDQTLGGAAWSALISEWAYMPAQVPEGATVALDFTITVTGQTG
jgi:hypothetical protein